MEARIEKHGTGKNLIIEVCDEDEAALLDEFGYEDIPLEAILCHETGRTELHIEIRHH